MAFSYYRIIICRICRPCSPTRARFRDRGVDCFKLCFLWQSIWGHFSRFIQLLVRTAESYGSSVTFPMLCFM